MKVKLKEDLVLQETKEGVVIQILVVPRASRTRVVGLYDGGLKVSVTAPPVDGAANEELIEAMALFCGLRKGEVRLIAGQTGQQTLFEWHHRQGDT